MSRPKCLRLSAGLAACGVLLMLGACSDAVMNPAGAIARQQRDIILISTGLMMLIIVPVMVLTVVFAWRYRASNPDADYDPDFDHSTSLELVIWSAPLLIIICLGALTWSATHVLDPFRRLDQRAASLSGSTLAPQVAPPMRIEVVALDWKWLFIYPELGIATVNDLALPVNREVRFDITSSNMMNAFYAPTLAGMIYAMPGMRSTLHAALERPVESEGFSANYSGAGFSDMRFALHGLDQAGFDRWVARVRGSGVGLATPVYRTLVKPSEKVPPMHFAAVEQGLFRRIVERCVEPGTPCMSDHMRHSGTDSMPQGGKPEGALFKEGQEKGEGKNVTSPAEPEAAPGAATPGDHRNRDISMRADPTHPAAPPSAERT